MAPTSSILLLAAVAVFATAQSIPSCGAGQLCPEDSPCCSQYGQCGIGAYCLGGCNPSFSHSLDSCVPAPQCNADNFALSSLDDVQAIDYYLGDAEEANWQATGRPVDYNDDSILLTMAPDTVGTLLASTHYVWYGKISATLTTAQGAGVVTAFIMMSDVKDEIDFEFIGVDTENAQSNFYFQGITNYENSKNLTVGDTVGEPHTYTIDWKPDGITWEIDGKPMRELKKSDTFNETTNKYYFPQTPSRVMLSLWPAGLPSNGEGTIEWAGGLVDWDSQYMVNGYYAAMFKDISVECYDPPSDAGSGSASYKYTNTNGEEGDVELSDDLVVLASLQASGEDPEKGAVEEDDGGDSEDAPQSVPGMVGGGSRQDGETSSGGSAGSPDGTGTSVDGGFNQGEDGSSEDSAVSVRQSVSGSIFAVVVALLALTVL